MTQGLHDSDLECTKKETKIALKKCYYNKMKVKYNIKYISIISLKRNTL